MYVKIQHRDGSKIININRRKAIRERCLNCSAWKYKEVSECRRISCKLFPFRTGTGKQNSQLRSKAIRRYCLWCMNEKQKRVGHCTSVDCSLHPYRKWSIDRSAEIEPSQIKQYLEGSKADKKAALVQNHSETVKTLNTAT